MKLCIIFISLVLGQVRFQVFCMEKKSAKESFNDKMSVISCVLLDSIQHHENFFHINLKLRSISKKKNIGDIIKEFKKFHGIPLNSKNYENDYVYTVILHLLDSEWQDRSTQPKLKKFNFPFLGRKTKDVDIELVEIHNNQNNDWSSGYKPFEIIYKLPQDIANTILEQSVIDIIQLKTIYDCLNYKIIQYNRNKKKSDHRRLYHRVLNNKNYLQFTLAFLDNSAWDKSFIYTYLNKIDFVYCMLEYMIERVNASRLYQILNWQIPINTTYLKKEEDKNKVYLIANAPIVEILKLILWGMESGDEQNRKRIIDVLDDSQKILIKIDNTDDESSENTLRSIFYTYYVFDFYMKIRM